MNSKKFKRTDVLLRTTSTAKQKHFAHNDNVATYGSIEAAASHAPVLHYCDITRQVAKYRDPKTGLRYAHAGIYRHIQVLDPKHVAALVAMRNLRKGSDVETTGGGGGGSTASTQKTKGDRGGG